MHLMSNAQHLELFIFEIGYQLACLTIFNTISELAGQSFYNASYNGC